MRTVTFKSVFDSVLRLRGVDPATVANIDQLPYSEIAVHLNRRVREGWELAWWPEWTLLESRTSDASGYIALQQTGLAKIGVVKDVWTSNPRTSSSAKTIDFYITNNGIETNTASTAFFVEFRKRPPRFTTTYYQPNGNVYSDGNLVFWPLAVDTQLYGDCYEARLQAAGGYAWEKQELPFVLEQWAIWSAFADSIMQDGQRERAQEIMATTAYPELRRARDIEMNQNGLYASGRVRIHGT